MRAVPFRREGRAPRSAAPPSAPGSFTAVAAARTTPAPNASPRPEAAAIGVDGERDGDDRERRRCGLRLDGRRRSRRKRPRDGHHRGCDDAGDRAAGEPAADVRGDDRGERTTASPVRTPVTRVAERIRDGDEEQIPAGRLVEEHVLPERLAVAQRVEARRGSCPRRSSDTSGGPACRGRAAAARTSASAPGFRDERQPQRARAAVPGGDRRAHGLGAPPAAAAAVAELSAARSRGARARGTAGAPSPRRRCGRRTRRRRRSRSAGSRR